ncbi:hypothetical protein GOODEAATRI_002558 [Goodea atripinnis]|uniref:Uncharacterized protein n=1 Tax=Goodea atripinnis TaxID=208336 RepID=A0ABV0MNQ8_9TELE
MEMQSNIHHHSCSHPHGFCSESVDGASGFGGSYHAPTHQHGEEMLELPRRSKYQSPDKFAMSKRVFPWMKESRPSNQNLRGSLGRYDIKQTENGLRLPFPIYTVKGNF